MYSACTLHTPGGGVLFASVAIRCTLIRLFTIRYAAFQGYCRELKKRKKHKTFIVKPANGAMGNG